MTLKIGEKYCAAINRIWAGALGTLWQGEFDDLPWTTVRRQCVGVDTAKQKNTYPMIYPACDPLRSVDNAGTASSNSEPLVTVAITAYERSDLFRICLTSVCRQSYRNLEIYVFDNSNTDAVQDCVTELADDRIRYARNVANIRDIVNINHQKAFVPRAGDYHIVLSSDWSLTERAIELMVAVLVSDSSICAVAANECRVDLLSGERTPHRIRFQDYVLESVPNSHDRVDTHRMIRDAYFTLTGIGIPYHTLMASDLLTYANLEPVYLSQSQEEQIGLEILMQKPAFGMIRQELFVDLSNDRQYRTEHFHKHRHFTQAIARQQFLEKHYQALLSLGFNVTLLQLGLVRLFARCVYRYPTERPFDSACRAAQVALPLLGGACLLLLLLPLAAYHIVRKHRIRRKRRTS